MSMSTSYSQPYESLNSTAVLTKIPTRRSGRSRSVGRSPKKFETSLDHEFSRDHMWRKSDLSQTNNHLSNRSNVVVISHDNNLHKRVSFDSTRSSRSSGSSFSKPLPKPRTSISKMSDSEKEKLNHFNRNSFSEDRKLSDSHSKHKTTVTVHLSKTKSTPNLMSRSIENLKMPESKKTDSLKLRRPSTRSQASNFVPVNSKSNSLTETIPVDSPKREENKPIELNSLQVFRQSKYKNRSKAETKIRQLEHLQRNGHCAELVDCLSQRMNPHVYENQNSLGVINFLNKNGMVTSTKINSCPVKKSRSVPNIATPKNSTFNQDHFYTEIKEQRIMPQLNKNIIPPRIFRKKVTFSTFHDPIQEDPFSRNKKIFPAKFWGMVQVTQALRSKTDEERRRISNLCYHAIISGAENNSLRFLGKVDLSRSEECIFFVLDEKSFEMRDSDGILIVQHKFSDISVVSQMEDPCLFVYVGRCKQNGRVGITIRFNKAKHASYIFDAFRTINR